MVKKWLKTDRLLFIAGGLVLLSLGLQAQVEPTSSSSEEAAEISQMIPVEMLDSLNAVINADFETVKPILQESCFDCHSNQTEYPWYHALPLIKGLMDGHIKEGLEHLDLSDGFPFNKGEKDQLHILEEMKEEIDEGAMPLLSYRMLHWGSLIEGEEQDSLFAWIDRTSARLTGFNKMYPAAAQPKDEIKDKSSEVHDH